MAKKSKKNDNTGVIIGIAIAAIIVVAIVICFV